MIEPTGYCWSCGRQVKDGELFCNDTHKHKWERQNDAQIIKGKKAGYGAKGATH